MMSEATKDFILLIVDDNPENLKLLVKSFQKESYRIEFTDNGKAAIDFINKKQFDLILLDINMPEIDGFEVCKAIRSQPRMDNVPIIFLSAESDRESIIKGFELGAQDYLTKPFERRELLARVKTHLALKSNIEKLAELNLLLEEKVIQRTCLLSKALEKAEESDRLKSAFLANISHEIRTPMNGILSFVELLKKPGLSGEKQQYYMDIITQSGHRMLNIINNIVDISKIESGAINIKIQKTHLNQIMKYLYSFFKIKCTNKGIQLNYSGDLTDDECVIDADKDKLVDALINLIDNALKFTNSGTINFGYHCVGDIIEFYVSDTGIGIAKEKQTLIFERFVQADSSLTREYEGAGLGLSIAKSYIEMLDGKIWVESKLGAGSTFFFTIPLLKSNTNQTEINKPQSVSNKLQPINILIAEDDLISIQYFKEIFAEKNVNLFFANNGQRAIEIVNEIPEINMVLMDIKMPIMDGNEATRQIKKIKPQLPIIAQTAHAMSGDKEKMKMVGCDDYIVKPIQEDLLFEIINKYITN